MIARSIIFTFVIALHSLCFAEEDIDIELVKKATDELSYLKKIQFINLYTTKNFGASSDSNIARIRGIEVIEKNDRVPFNTLVRETYQIQTVPRSASNDYKKLFGLSDTQLFAIPIFQEGDWGKWGIGPMFIFPTATRVSTGQGKWQIGPAFGFAYLGIPMWQFELLVQNPISFAGSHKRSYINQMFCQPIITHHLKKGWYLKSDAEMTFIWNKRSVVIPVNLGIGRVFDLWGQKVNFTAYSQWMAYHRNTSTAKYTVKVQLDMLFPK